MKTIKLDDGTTLYCYLEDSVTGRVCVTLRETAPGLYTACREWWNDPQGAIDLYDSMDAEKGEAQNKKIERLAWRGEILSDGTSRFSPPTKAME